MYRDDNLPRLIYNSDGDSTTLLAFDSEITPEQACRDIEEVVGTKVDVFCNSMGRGDDTFSHPTKFGDIYGEGVTEWPDGENVQWVRTMAENTKALLDANIDILELLAKRAHERELQFWPALRMNDIHEDDAARFGAFRSQFKKDHPELLLGSPYPTRHGYGYPQDDFTWAFDFSKEEVRERKLGLILETCEKYDVDGFELDYQRGAWYFKDGTEMENMPLMTDFQRQVRAGTREIAERKGRPFTLMARVPPNFKRCIGVGLDVATWIKDELVDLIIPMHGAYLDMGADVRGFVECAGGTRVRVGGGLEHWAKGYKYAGTDMLYAAALSFWHQGASCIYLFNYDCHRQLGANDPYTPEEIKKLNELHDPEILARKDKRYIVTVDMMNRLPSEGGIHPLPEMIDASAKRREFVLWIGDDVESARCDGALGDLWLRLTFARSIDEKQQIAVELNDKILGESHRIEAPTCTTWRFPTDHVVQGENKIAVSVDKLLQNEALRLEGIELVITYRS